MSDDPVRTRVSIDTGELSFQEWFVQRGCSPPVHGLRYEGMEAARPSGAAVAALTEAELVVIGPSNPLLSIDPILLLLGPHLERKPVIAVSPIVGGRSLKGPTTALMAQLGEEPTSLGVARRYARLATDLVLDEEDRDLEDGVAGLGLRPHVVDTLMADAGAERRLAVELLGMRSGV